MSRVAQVLAMPPEGMIPASVAQEAVRELTAERLSVAVERQLTIDMWRELGTRNLLRGVPLADPSPDAKWDSNLETVARGLIQSARGA